MFPRLRAVSLFLLSPYLSGMLLATFPSIVTVVHALFEPCLSEKEQEYASCTPAPDHLLQQSVELQNLHVQVVYSFTGIRSVSIRLPPYLPAPGRQFSDHSRTG